MYAELVKAYKAGTVSFKYVQTFNMDEYVGLPEEHAQSYHTFMAEHLFKVDKQRVYKKKNILANFIFLSFRTSTSIRRTSTF